MSSTGHLSELDLLRSQVADLSRELAERDRAAQDLQEQSDLLRAIVEGTAAETGEEFFASLVTHLTSILHVQYAIIGEVQGDRIKRIHTLAVSVGGALVDNFEYDLTHTPCATALTETFAYFDRDLQATFPHFHRLADFGAEGYCAVPLRTKSGAVIGLLVVMDTKPLEHSDSLQSLLGVFAPRIAAEFERRRAEQERAQAQADLHNVIETIPDVVFALNTQGNMVKWNRRVAVVTGYSPEELLNKSALAFVPPEEQASTAAAIQRVFTEGYAELEGHMQTKDHRLIPYHWTGALLKNTHGEPIGVIGVGRDVSDKKRRECALRAAIEERERISQDLHDGILQSLFAVGLTLEVSKSMMSTRVCKTSGASLNQAIDQLNDVMREIRNFIAGLGSDLLQGKDFSAAVKHMLALLTQNQATRVRLAVEDRAAKAVSAEQSLHLFRVIQEAVSNCIRHGHAQEARVSLKMLKQGVRLSIRDNGRGFNPKAAKGTGHGLRNMAARAEKFGGRFTVLSKVNAGTRIVLDLPKEVSDVPR